MAKRPIQGAAERYFDFLRTPFVDDEGKKRQPAATKFIDVLRDVHGAYKPRYDLTKCLAGTHPGFTGKVWFWSDLHWSHQNIIKYCQRPFANAKEMNTALLENCLARVSKDDIMVFGGDLVMGSDLEGTNWFLRSIPAYKINVLGNHDIHIKTDLMLKLAFDEVAACVEFAYQETPILLTHYPVPETILADGQMNMHGHIHNSQMHPSLGSGKRHINICVEHTGYASVSLDWLTHGQL